MQADGRQRHKKIVATNKKLRHDFEVMMSMEAGIALHGTEVKSLRAGKCTLQDAYALFPNPYNNEFFLQNFHIAPYEQGNINNHDPMRQRKLLVHQKEAVKLRTQIQEKGLTIMPYSIYFWGPYVKVELCVVRAKKKYDKRETLKERDTERDIRREYRFR